MVKRAAGITDSSELVRVAFALGWVIAEVYHYPISTKPSEVPSQPPDRLPGLSNLTEYEQMETRLRQISVALSQLLSADAGKPANTLRDRIDATVVTDRNTPEAVRLLLALLHTEILQALTAQDTTLGKAYGLGRALAETYLLPLRADATTRARVWTDTFDPFRLANLYGWLSDLKSAVPDHAASAVTGSLERWSEWVLTQTPKDATVPWDRDWAATDRALSRQGERWRAVLTGEKQANDWLRATDFVAAGSAFVARLSNLVSRTFAEHKGRLIFVGLALAVVVAGAVYVAISTNNAAALWAWLLPAVAGLGVWKTLGKGLSTGIARLEGPLWEVELGESIAVAITRLPPDAPAPKRQDPDGVGALV
jgi:hypothetical protein